MVLQDMAVWAGNSSQGNFQGSDCKSKAGHHARLPAGARTGLARVPPGEVSFCGEGLEFPVQPGSPLGEAPGPVFFEEPQLAPGFEEVAMLLGDALLLVPAT